MVGAAAPGGGSQQRPDGKQGPATFEEMGIPQGKNEGDCVSFFLLFFPLLLLCVVLWFVKMVANHCVIGCYVMLYPYLGSFGAAGGRVWVLAVGGAGQAVVYTDGALIEY
jgi:hypothetical protein